MENLLAIENLNVDFALRSQVLRAVNDVSLTVDKGERLGLVGESGAGKSVLGFSIINLISKPGYIDSGRVLFQGTDISRYSDEQMRTIRGNRISMIFQDPMMTLNPVLTVGAQMRETLQAHTRLSDRDATAICLDKLRKVYIPSPSRRLAQFPHEFSGGMRQRISIAMALQAEPTLLMADEPTTALDATLEVQIIHLLKELQEVMGCSILFISHHLGVIAELCNHVVVMYAGEVMEQGTTRDVFHHPAHPYTEKLLQCDPAGVAEKTRTLPTIPGGIPDLVQLPAGCVFRNRCEHAMPLCDRAVPEWSEARPGHFVRCYRQNS